MRQDIQVLRGYAILIVIIYHAQLNVLDAGYLGVDIFFVISGFLITSMVSNQIQKGSFTFTEFYFRRAKRLLPAAYSTFFVATILSMWLLTSYEFEQFMWQLWGAITFSSNIVLWRQGSYFGGEAEIKPLLHTWSLAIEEQYYLILPGLLYFIARRYWLKAVMLTLVASAVLCYFVMQWRPDVAFYLSPTRGWEVAIGSLGALIAGVDKFEVLARRLFWPSLFFLIVLPIFPMSHMHPGPDAWVVCCSTVIVILSKHSFLDHGRLNGVLSKVGDWSYSLYLVHWPVFAFMSNIWMGDLPNLAKFAGLFIAFLLGLLQYRYIENPIHRASINFSWQKVGILTGVTCMLMVMPFLFYKSQLFRSEYVEIRQGNTGLSPKCAFRDQFTPIAECRTSEAPKTLVWGDSYAMHIVSGLSEQKELGGLIQATKYVCGPLLGVAPISHAVGGTQNRRWAEECIAFNDSVLNYVINNPSIEIVILSTMFRQYMTADVFHNLLRGNAGFFEEAGTIDVTMRGLAHTVERLRAHGKKVVLIAPPPALDWDAGRCAERIQRGLFVLGPYADCVTKDIDYQIKRSNVLTLLQKIPSQLGVDVISFDDALRSGDGYAPTIDGQIIFIANGHISNAGSVVLAKRMALGSKIITVAK